MDTTAGFTDAHVYERMLERAHWGGGGLHHRSRVRACPAGKQAGHHVLSSTVSDHRWIDDTWSWQPGSLCYVGELCRGPVQMTTGAGLQCSKVLQAEGVNRRFIRRLDSVLETVNILVDIDHNHSLRTNRPGTGTHSNEPTSYKVGRQGFRWTMVSREPWSISERMKCSSEEFAPIERDATTAIRSRSVAAV